ncbi:MAG: AraC family transcriptional regulator [Mobilitalea sp.]
MRVKHCELLSDDGKTVSNLNSYLKEIYTDDTMKELHFNDNTNSSELYMYYCGISSCLPGHTWGPAIREHYVIHYVLSGEGTLRVKDKIYHLKENEGFLLSPNEVTIYSASVENPWEYVWVGFHGLNAYNYLRLSEITQEEPIFKFTRGDQLKNCMLEMVKVNNEYTHSTNLRIQSLLYSLFAELVENAQQSNSVNPHTTKSQYIRKAIDYIHTNYMEHITVADLANYVGLDRSYFTTIFKECLNTPPQKYLTQYKINKACSLLKDNTFSIAEIATISGYNDPVVFQKAFKNTIGISPSKYRSSHLINIT